MRTASVLPLLLFTTLLGAQPKLGAPLPLTNTRYENVNAEAKLVSNGRDVFLAWSRGTVRINPVIEGSSRVGRPILPVAAYFDVIWTGRHFLAVSHNSVRLLDANGEPVTAPLRHDLTGGRPHMATNGKNVAVLMGTTAYVLTLEGQRSPAPSATLSPETNASAAIASNRTAYAAVTVSSTGVSIASIDAQGIVGEIQWTDGAGASGTPAIASDGQGYLAAWNEQDGSIRGAFVDAAGAIATASFAIAAPAPPDRLELGSIVWTGDRYAVAYKTRNDPQQVSRASVIYVGRDQHTSSATLLPGSAESYAYRPSLLFTAGRLHASWCTEKGTVVRDVAREADAAIPAVWSANYQAGPAAVSSDDATLTVWYEARQQRASWWMGIRGSDGSWRERELYAYDVGGKPLIASDRREFLIVRRDPATQTSIATRIARDGSAYPVTTTIPFEAADVAWNGTQYVIVGYDEPQRQLVAAFLTPSGALSPTRRIGSDSVYFLGTPAVAADRNGNVLVVWAQQVITVQPVFGPPDLYGVIVNGQLQTSGPPFEIERGVATPVYFDVAWNGTAYVAVSVRDDLGIIARNVSASGVALAPARQISDASPFTLQATDVRDGVAVSWTAQTSDGLMDHVMLFERNNTRTLISREPRQPLFDPQSFTVTAMPDGRLAYLRMRTADEAPHYGSERIAMTIAEVNGVPEAPVASVSRYSESSVRVTWSAPPQIVSGYRLEYKVGAGGEWTELERWFAPHQREAVLALTSQRNASYFFRVRAWSEAGTSAYSNETALTVIRRRAVR